MYKRKNENIKTSLLLSSSFAIKSVFLSLRTLFRKCLLSRWNISNLRAIKSVDRRISRTPEMSIPRFWGSYTFKWSVGCVCVQHIAGKFVSRDMTNNLWCLTVVTKWAYDEEETISKEFLNSRTNIVVVVVGLIYDINVGDLEEYVPSTYQVDSS